MGVPVSHYTTPNGKIKCEIRADHLERLNQQSIYRKHLKKENWLEVKKFKEELGEFVFSNTHCIKQLHELSERIKSIINFIEKKKKVNKQLILENFKLASQMLDMAHKNEKKRIFNIIDYKGRDNQKLPQEVKRWLYTTFHKNTQSNIKPEIKRFRCIVNVIRFGHIISNIQKKSILYNIPTLVRSDIQNSHLWNYDIFQLDSMCNGNTLRFLSGYLLNTFDVFNIFKIPLIVFENFIIKIQEGYSKYDNPYHNNMHASDVTQTVYSIITYCSNYSIYLSSTEIFALIFSAIIHDHEHTGTNNSFHVSTRSELAILYNDASVLENHHIASAFKILQDKDCNILYNMTAEQYRKFRSLTITLVLATDMAFHFEQIKNITEMLEFKDEITTVKALSMILHAADISHPAKIWKYHSKWSTMLTKEFFNQGKKEKQLNIPISPLCNESTCNIAKSQIGFVTYIVKPCFELLSKMLKKILQQYYVEVGIPKSNSFIDFKEDVYEGISRNVTFIEKKTNVNWLNSEIWFECCNSNILDWNKIVEKDENEQN